MPFQTYCNCFSSTAKFQGIACSNRSGSWITFNIKTLLCYFPGEDSTTINDTEIKEIQTLWCSTENILKPSV